MRLIVIIGLAFTLVACASVPSQTVSDDTSVWDGIIGQEIGDPSGPIAIVGTGSGGGGVGGGALAPTDPILDENLPLATYERPDETRGAAVHLPSQPYRVQMGGMEPYWRASGRYYEGAVGLVMDVSLVAADRPPLQVRLSAETDYLSQGDRLFEGVTANGMRVSLSLQAGRCEDENGQIRGYFIELEAFDRFFSGCGHEEGGQWDWSRLVPQYSEEISTCLAEFEDVVGVVDIYAPSEALLAIRIIDDQENRFECSLRSSDGSIASVRQIGAVDIHLNEGRTVFLPGFPPTRDACRQYEPVRHSNGVMIGVFAHDVCVNPRRHAQAPDRFGES